MHRPARVSSGWSAFPASPSTFGRYRLGPRGFPHLRCPQGLATSTNFALCALGSTSETLAHAGAALATPPLLSFLRPTVVFTCDVLLPAPLPGLRGAGANLALAEHPRGFSPPRCVDPSHGCGLVASHIRLLGSLRFACPVARGACARNLGSAPRNAVHTLRRIPLIDSRTTSLWPLPPYRYTRARSSSACTDVDGNAVRSFGGRLAAPPRARIRPVLRVLWP